MEKRDEDEQSDKYVPTNPLRAAAQPQPSHNVNIFPDNFLLLATICSHIIICRCRRHRIHIYICKRKSTLILEGVADLPRPIHRPINNSSRRNGDAVTNWC